MYCSSCGNELSKTHKFCTQCGNRVPDNIEVSAKDGPRVILKTYSTLNECIRFFLLALVTLGLYAPYWAWRKWVFVGKMSNERIPAKFFGLFFIFTSFSLFARIKSLNNSRTELQANYSPGMLGTLLLTLSFISNVSYKGTESLSYTLFYLTAICLMETIIIARPTAALVQLLNNDDEAAIKYGNIGHSPAMISILTAIFALAVYGSYLIYSGINE